MRYGDHLHLTYFNRKVNDVPKPPNERRAEFKFGTGKVALAKTQGILPDLSQS